MEQISKILSSYLREIADKIDLGECALSEPEQIALLKQIAHQKVNKSQAADLLGISVRTFDRKVQNREIPQGKKDLGSNQLYWYRDELELIQNY